MAHKFADDTPKDDEIDGVITQDMPARALKIENRHLFRRYSSERRLEELLDWDFRDGDCYHVISQGDIDSLTYLKMVIRQQPLKYCLLSTWCMAMADVDEIGRWLENGRIARLDAYVGEIFKGSYASEYAALKPMIERHGGRVAIFRNHSKIFAGFGERFYFAIESSANINTNPRCENATVTISREAAMFYKEFFDGIKSFERDCDDWRPYGSA
jgi:hypothetical protein